VRSNHSQNHPRQLRQHLSPTAHATLPSLATTTILPGDATGLDLPTNHDRYRIFAITCPFHDDGFWLDLKTNHPAEWADAVAFDHAIRHGSARANADGHPLRGTYYLHSSRVPLDQAVLRPAPRRSADRPGCGPWTCPHTPPVDDPPDTAQAAPATGTAGTRAAGPLREVA
jgi:hypothetical protein